MDNYENDVMDVVEMMDQPFGIQIIDGFLFSVSETRESVGISDLDFDPDYS
jgi:hypothetical protein